MSRRTIRERVQENEGTRGLYGCNPSLQPRFQGKVADFMVLKCGAMAQLK
jgi:hypothetical protein